MTKQEAWKILSQVGAKFVGNLSDHQMVQKALEALKPEGSKVEAGD